MYNKLEGISVREGGGEEKKGHNNSFFLNLYVCMYVCM